VASLGWVVEAKAPKRIKFSSCCEQESRVKARIADKRRMASTGGSAYLNTSRCFHKLGEEDLESVKGRKMRAQRGEGYAWTQEQVQGNLGSASHEDGNVVELFFLLVAAAARFLQRGERLAQGEQARHGARNNKNNLASQRLGERAGPEPAL
jgi:hypothetical protein